MIRRLVLVSVVCFLSITACLTFAGWYLIGWPLPVVVTGALGATAIIFLVIHAVTVLLERAETRADRQDRRPR